MSASLLRPQTQAQAKAAPFIMGKRPVGTCWWLRARLGADCARHLAAQGRNHRLRGGEIVFSGSTAKSAALCGLATRERAQTSRLTWLELSRFRPPCWEPPSGRLGRPSGALATCARRAVRVAVAPPALISYYWHVRLPMFDLAAGLAESVLALACRRMGLASWTGLHCPPVRWASLSLARLAVVVVVVVVGGGGGGKHARSSRPPPRLGARLLISAYLACRRAKRPRVFAPADWPSINQRSRAPFRFGGGSCAQCDRLSVGGAGQSAFGGGRKLHSSDMFRSLRETNFN